MQEYFDKHGIIKLHIDGAHPVENTPLYHITYLIKNDIYTNESVHKVLDFFVEDGKINTTRSHDNMTAVLTYLTIARKKAFLHNIVKRRVDIFIKNFRIKPDYTHPRDILYIAMLQNKWWFWLLSPLWFVVFLAIFLFMGFKKYKVRPTFLNRFKNKDILGVKVLEAPMQGGHYYKKYKKIGGSTYYKYYWFKTDTEILYWIRTKLPWYYLPIHLTRPFVVPLLKKKYNKDWFYGMMDVYYLDAGHPNRRRS